MTTFLKEVSIKSTCTELKSAGLGGSRLDQWGEGGDIKRKPNRLTDGKKDYTQQALGKREKGMKSSPRGEKRF